MSKESLKEKHRKEIHALIDQIECDTHLKVILEILKSMLAMIKSGKMRI